MEEETVMARLMLGISLTSEAVRVLRRRKGGGQKVLRGRH